MEAYFNSAYEKVIYSMKAYGKVPQHNADSINGLVMGFVSEQVHMITLLTHKNIILPFCRGPF